MLVGGNACRLLLWQGVNIILRGDLWAINSTSVNSNKYTISILRRTIASIVLSFSVYHSENNCCFHSISLFLHHIAFHRLFFNLHRTVILYTTTNPNNIKQYR